jgi:murein L,D-transpeptidase YcbB/YkuD
VSTRNHGFCEPGFAAVGEAFERGFAERGELGAAVAVHLNGNLVVDLRGGLADPETRSPWAEDTIAHAYSVSKPLMATCALVLADRGKLDLDAPVARYWPEYAQAGKEATLVRHLLAHQTGILALREPQPPAALLDSAISSRNIEGSLQDLLPQRAGYLRLREVLARYRDTAARGGWGTVPDGPKLAKGSTGERVIALRNRLMATGDWSSAKESFSDLFDEALQQGVHKFQQHHGLEGDGIVGPSTLAALNVSVKDRIEQIKVNRERWRWLTRDLEKEFILVNIANFELYMVKNESPIARMRVVVGRRYRPTPVFASIMTHLVINPSWNVPRSIAVREMLPLLQKDPTYLEKENLKVFEGWRPEEKELDPGAIDWAAITPADFKFHFRQTPGPRNALGQLKFVFPNQFDVYMHDTPARDLFKKPSREFSHGCIRIERPLDLAEHVLRGDSAWTRDKLTAAIESSKERTVALPRPLPVYILYATAWVDRNGDLQLRRDTYKLDELVAKAISVPGI